VVEDASAAITLAETVVATQTLHAGGKFDSKSERRERRCTMPPASGDIRLL